MAAPGTKRSQVAAVHKKSACAAANDQATAEAKDVIKTFGRLLPQIQNTLDQLKCTCTYASSDTPVASIEALK